MLPAGTTSADVSARRRGRLRAVVKGTQNGFQKGFYKKVLQGCVGRGSSFRVLSG